MRAHLLVLTVLATAGVVTPAVGTTPATSTSGSGAIAFSTGDIDAVNADGSGLRRLVENASNPRWSPDGRLLAFTRGGGLFVVPSQGGRERRLADADDEAPSWSPDGKRIAFGYGRIHVAAVNGFGSVRLTDESLDDQPAWSPDGTAIAFVRFDREQVDKDLYRIAPDGGNLRRLRSDVCDFVRPAWSPDGMHIAVVDHESEDLYAVDAQGRETRLARGSCSEAGPVWSPDGARIAFGRINGTYVVNRDRTRLRRVSPRRAQAVNWSPDGKSLTLAEEVRVGSALEAGDLWIVSLETSRERRITQGFRYGYGTSDPQWHPRGWRTVRLRGRPISPAIPTDAKVVKGVLVASSTIDMLAADGSRVALAYSSSAPCIESWDVRSGALVRYLENACVSEERGGEVAGINALALAGSRVAWVSYLETHHYYESVFTATAVRPRPTEIFDIRDSGEVGNLEGDGSVLAFAYGRTLLRVAGDRAIRIRSEKRALGVLSIDAGRIAVRSSDGSVALVDARGALLRKLSIRVSRTSPVALNGGQVVAQRGRRVSVYDTRTGERGRVWPIRGSLRDLHSGVAVSVSGTTVYALRLSDGKTTSIRVPGGGPVHAQIEKSGLFYSYSTASKQRPGRVQFMPLSVLGERLG